MTGPVTIVEVGPRDGFQSIAPFIPTAEKISLLKALYGAGLRRIEATAFVSERAVPQMRDAADIVAAAADLPELDVQVLTPSARQAERALEAGANHLAFVLSVSEAHNHSNVRRTPGESAIDYRHVISQLPPSAKVRLNLATAFDCPFAGPVPVQDVLDLLDGLVDHRSDVEIALCDTTGRVTPDRVEELFCRVSDRYSGPTWAFHAHDTYGMGVANVIAAHRAGVEVIDASVAGLGGCPFAPGATGNVATEDVVWTLERMGADTGVRLEALIAVAARAAHLPGAQIGGRVRQALLG